MSTKSGFTWATSGLLWTWLAGIVVAALIGFFVGSTTGNLTLGLAWGIALALAWIIAFALVRSRRRRPYRAIDDDDEPTEP